MLLPSLNLECSLHQSCIIEALLRIYCSHKHIAGCLCPRQRALFELCMAHMTALVTTAEAAVARATASTKPSISSPGHCTSTSDGHQPWPYTPVDSTSGEGGEDRARKSQATADHFAVSQRQGSAEQDDVGAGTDGTRRERAASRWNRESDGAQRDVAFTLRQRVNTNSTDSDGGWSFPGSVGASGAGGGDIEIHQFLPPEGVEVCLCRVRSKHG